MTYLHREAWQAALERAAGNLLARCGSGVDPELYRLGTGPCRVHGPACACVIYGAILRHVPWGETDPERLAAQLLPDPGTVQPRPSGLGESLIHVPKGEWHFRAF
jgi:hypothetical protein